MQHHEFTPQKGKNYKEYPIIHPFTFKIYLVINSQGKDFCMHTHWLTYGDAQKMKRRKRKKRIELVNNGIKMKKIKNENENL